MEKAEYPDTVSSTQNNIGPYGLCAEIEFAKTILASGWVKDHRPLSGMIIGLPDTGKSETLMMFSGCRGVLIINDFTAYGISKLIDDLKQCTHIIIPDLLKILERSPRIANEVISMLNTLAEEGLQRISTYNINIYLEQPIRRGFLTSLTLEAFNRRRSHWRNIGFTSRVVPFFFGYNEEDLARARETIKRSQNIFRPLTLNFKEKKEIHISQKLLDDIERIAQFMGVINDDFTAFRTLRNAITFVKARALLNEREEVTDEDIRFLRAMVPFWFNPIVGNDCDYYIINTLPISTSELVKKLRDEHGYSERLVYQRLKILKEKGVLKKKNNCWHTRY